MSYHDNLGKRAENKVSLLFMGNDSTIDIFHAQEIGEKFPLVDILVMRLNRKSCFFVQVKSISKKTKNQRSRSFKSADINSMKGLNAPCYVAVYKEKDNSIYVKSVVDMKSATFKLEKKYRVLTERARLERYLNLIAKRLDG